MLFVLMCYTLMYCLWVNSWVSMCRCLLVHVNCYAYNGVRKSFNSLRYGDSTLLIMRHDNLCRYGTVRTQCLHITVITIHSLSDPWLHWLLFIDWSVKKTLKQRNQQIQSHFYNCIVLYNFIITSLFIFKAMVFFVQPVCLAKLDCPGERQVCRNFNCYEEPSKFESKFSLFAALCSKKN